MKESIANIVGLCGKATPDIPDYLRRDLVRLTGQPIGEGKWYFFAVANRTMVSAYGPFDTFEEAKKKGIAWQAHIQQLAEACGLKMQTKETGEVPISMASDEMPESRDLAAAAFAALVIDKASKMH